MLTAVSPIDGRYRGKTEALAEYFSEYALIRYRVRVEVEYFIALMHLPLPQLQGIPVSDEQLRDIYRNFSEQDAQRVKDIEAVTNHDVEAVEYYIKEQFDKLGNLEQYKEFMQDISDEIDRENQIISDLLSLVRMDKKAADLNIEEISINYLSTLLMQISGLEMPAYQQYLARIYQDLPVITALGCRDKDGNYFQADQATALKGLVQDYRCVAYNNLSDTTNRCDSLFYLPSWQSS